MPLQLPLNQSVKSKYTSGPAAPGESTGDEYVFIKNPEIIYTGYYYETGGKIFAGKEFSPVAQELIKKISVVKNTLIENPSTTDYARLSGMIVNSIPLKTVVFNPSKEDINNGMVRYFAKKVASNVIDINEITEEAYIALAKDPFYQTTKINYTFNRITEGLNEFNRQMPGLKEYLLQEIIVQQYGIFKQGELPPDTPPDDREPYSPKADGFSKFG